jgi:cbb3-type cytochrome oxidase subunit 3
MQPVIAAIAFIASTILFIAIAIHAYKNNFAGQFAK